MAILNCSETFWSYQADAMGAVLVCGFGQYMTLNKEDKGG